MSDTNRVRLAYIEEASGSIGVVPTPTVANPMKAIRFINDSLMADVTATESDEIRADRMTGDLIRALESGKGDLGIELQFPVVRAFLYDFMGGAFLNQWFTTFEAFNNGTADSVVTDVVTGTNVITVTSTAAGANSAAVAVGHLLRTSAFTSAANNALNRVSAVTGTTVTCAGATFATEAVPPATARLKVVGFRGASADLVAAVAPNRLTSTVLDFTTLGLAVGSYYKIGGATVAEQFATTANNGWVRISAIAANTITFDVVPTGWGADTGTAKTITVFIPDTLKNGTTRRSFTIEKQWMDLTTEFARYRGFIPGDMMLTFQAGQKVTGKLGWLGIAEDFNIVSTLGAATAAPTVDIMSSTWNVARITVDGVTLPAGNFVQKVDVNITNNMRGIPEIGNPYFADVGIGRFNCNINLSVYFKDSTLYNRFKNNGNVALAWRAFANGQALMFQAPRVKFPSGNRNTGGANQDANVEVACTTIADPVTGAEFMIDRFEEFA